MPCTDRILAARLLGSLILASLAAIATPIVHGEESTDQNPARWRAFATASQGPARLSYQGDLPVAVFAGTHAQIGTQHAALLARQTKPIGTYTRAVAVQFGFGPSWQSFLRASKALFARAPARFRDELDAAAQNPEFDADGARVFNTGLELRRLGCSTLIIEPQKSATGRLLFGRNFDFPGLGILDNYGLVMVYRPTGYHAFVSIGFPGQVGVFSGMNEAGLAVATLDVYTSADGSAEFEPAGEPLAIVFRRILEECETIDQAERLLRTVKPTTWTNLAVCDRHRGAVFEITPQQVARRDATDHLLPCTNHFRTPGLKMDLHCRRYDALEQAALLPRVGLRELHGRLHAANQGLLTIQTMIFEPETLTLHLAMGSPPASRRSLQRLELAPLIDGQSADGSLDSPAAGVVGVER